MLRDSGGERVEISEMSTIFLNKTSIPNLSNIVKFVLSTPVGNAVVEPIFNSESLDTDKRNSLQLGTAAIYIIVNMCRTFISVCNR